MSLLIWLILILIILLIFMCGWVYRLHRRVKILRWMVKKLEGLPTRHPFDPRLKSHTGDSEGHG